MAKMTGRTAIVTGASRGIGQAIAELFAQEGAHVVCVARTLNEGRSPVERLARQHGGRHPCSRGKATAVAADILVRGGMPEARRGGRRAAYGRIDTLVNNAALNYYIPTVDYPTNRWIKAFAVNVHAPFTLSKAVLPDMIAAGTRRHRQYSVRGRRSVPAEVLQGPNGPWGRHMYGASKAALERFTQGLGQEVRTMAASP